MLVFHIDMVLRIYKLILFLMLFDPLALRMMSMHDLSKQIPREAAITLSVMCWEWWIFAAGNSFY